MKNAFDVVQITNILDEPFYYKWDNEEYEPISAGTSVSLPRFLADYVTKKITDRAIIKAGKLKSINDKRVREEFGEKILGGLIKEVSQEKLTTKQKVEQVLKETDAVKLSDMPMHELRTLAKDKGINVKPVEKKVDLIERIKEADGQSD